MKFAGSGGSRVSASSRISESGKGKAMRRNTPSLPAINTQRLSLRVLDPEYAQICAGYALRNRDHHAASAPSRSDEYYQAEYWGQRLINAQKRFEEGTSIEMFLLARENPRRIIGNCSFDGFSFGVFQACYLGYNLDKGEIGNGYMTEALDAAISYVFDLTGIHRIMANYMPSNVRSGNVLKRLGFRVEGYARNYLRLNGAWQDHILTAMHSDEWKCRSNAP